MNLGPPCPQPCDHLALFSVEHSEHHNAKRPGYVITCCPCLSAEQVLVEVQAWGLNFADVFCALGLYKAAPKGDFIPGRQNTGRPEGSEATAYALSLWIEFKQLQLQAVLCSTAEQAILRVAAKATDM